MIKTTTQIAMICVLAIAIISTATADDKDREHDRDGNTRADHARMATAAIPCTPVDGLRFSCSNKSAHRPLRIVNAKCIIGAGDNPEVQTLFEFTKEVAPMTTQVEFVFCPGVPVPAFCTAQVYPRKNARCALTSPAGGLNAELK